jgi:signal transduction histidine kinase/ligand-binding sensor domain-containing protein/DNA-binding NarL/FixJ family response regulator
VKVGKVSLLLIIIWCRAACAFDPPQYQHQTWTIDDGLPVNVVNAVVQDRSGYLWLATNDGLVRFDGVRFAVFNNVSHPQMQSNRILGLVEGPQGSLWWRTEQLHLISLSNGEFHHHTEADGLPDRHVQRIVSDRHGRLWFATGNGVAILDDGTIRALDPDQVSGDIQWLHPMGNGEVWYRNEGSLGIYRYHAGRSERMLSTAAAAPGSAFHETDTGELLVALEGQVWRHDGQTLTSMSDGLHDQILITGLARDPSGRPWATSQSHGVLTWNDEAWQVQLSDSRGLFTGRIFLNDDDGGFWIVSDHGVYRDGHLVYRSDSEISDALIDDEGNVWLSLHRSGLKRLHPARLRTWGRAEGLPEPNVYPVLAASDGSVWAGTFGRGPARLVDGRIEAGFELPARSVSGFTHSLIERADGELLASVTREILRFSPDQGRFEPFEPIIEDNALSHYALFEDSDGRLWAGTSGGVFMLDNGQWRAVLDDTRSRSNYVRYFSEAPDGSLWMATNGQGILCLCGGELTRIDRTDGLVSDNIRSLLIEPAADGLVMWVGSEDRGLQRLAFSEGQTRPHSMIEIQQRHGLFDNVIHVILPDRFGRLWMNSNRGIFWVEQAELEAYAAGHVDRVQSIAFGPEDGLRNREGNGGIQPAGAVDDQGVLWFPTQGGLVQVDPARIARNFQPARPVIESISVDDTLVATFGSSTLALARDERDFRIRYTGISLSDPAGVQFRYRLVGYDHDWRSTTGREAVYTNIPSGTYRFELLAANGDGVWSSAPAGLSLQIVPRLHETLWFRSLLVLALGLGIVALLRWQALRSRRRQHELEVLVSERTRQLRDEKERTERQARHLQQLDQARTRFFTNISHEFRTPLTLIMGPIQAFLGRGRISARDREDHEMVLRNSKYLLRLINQILDLARLEAGEIQLQATHGDLAELVREVIALFEPICQRQDISFSVSIEPESIPLVFDEQRMEQVIANLLSNAIKFTPAGGEVCLELTKQGDTIRLAVLDTGIGISDDEQVLVFKRFYQADTAQSRSGEGTGVGLSLVKSLVALHGGQIQLQSAPGQGSRFTVLLDRQVLAAKAGVNPPTRAKDCLPIDPPLEVAPLESDQAESDRPLILVADDNLDMRAFIGHVLSDRYRLVEAANGRQALERCRETLPDLVMLDVMMPEMDGFAAGRAIQADATLRGIPMLFLTARDGLDDRLQGLKSGAVAYLTKPFEPDLLQAQIASLIAQQMHLRERLRQAAPAIAPPADPFEAQLVAVLNEGFMEADFGVAELAQAMHLDRSQLFRRIKSCSGLSPSRYIQHFRLDRAAELLANDPQTSVSQVAYGCGFNSLSWFSKCFLERFGTRPRDYPDND